MALRAGLVRIPAQAVVHGEGIGHAPGIFRVKRVIGTCGCEAGVDGVVPVVRRTEQQGRVWIAAPLAAIVDDILGEALREAELPLRETILEEVEKELAVLAAELQGMGTLNLGEVRHQDVGRRIFKQRHIAAGTDAGITVSYAVIGKCLVVVGSKCRR